MSWRSTVTGLARRRAVGLPLVLGMVWLGGWWLFVLAAWSGSLALHEFYAMTRSLRPLVIAGYLGLAADAASPPRPAASPGSAGEPVRDGRARVPAQGLRRHEAVGDGRGRRDGARRAWIGLGLVALLALRDAARARAAGGVHRAARRLGRRHARVLRRPRWSAGTSSRRRSRRARRGRGSSAARSATSSSRSSPSTRTATSSSRSARRSCSGGARASPRRSATCSSRCSSATWA